MATNKGAWDRIVQEISTYRPDHTRALGRCLGRRIERSVVLRLTGDLGSGKTCFVQGLAEGLQVPAEYSVTSPTYTLINQYPGRLALYHIDLYRLEGLDDIETIGFWELIGTDAVVAVEWAERIPEELWPAGNIALEFILADDDAHHIRLKGYGLEMDDLIKGAVDLWKATVDPSIR
jgi:tRNA threonylcarbamoyladenosine biosynthesis protein TsaE